MLEDFAKKGYFESFTNPDLPEDMRIQLRHLAFATQQEASQLKIKSVADFSAPYYNLYTALPIGILLDPTNLIGLPEGLIARSEGFKTAYEAKQFAQVARTAEQLVELTEGENRDEDGEHHAARGPEKPQDREHEQPEENGAVDAFGQGGHWEGGGSGAPRATL